MVFCDSSFQDYHNNEKESQSLFNRWFSAIMMHVYTILQNEKSQSLF